MCSLPKLQAGTSETTMPTSSPGYTPPANGTLRPWALDLAVKLCLSFLKCKMGMIIVGYC